MYANETAKPKFTHEELRRAIDSFRAEGGLVVQLPAEKVVLARLVGRRWGRFEEVTPYGASGPEEAAR